MYIYIYIYIYMYTYNILYLALQYIFIDDDSAPPRQSGPVAGVLNFLGLGGEDPAGWPAVAVAVFGCKTIGTP